MAYSDETIKDLILFLKDSRPEIRKTSIDIVLGLTVDDANVRQLVSNDVIPSLCTLISDIPGISRPALECLINITASSPDSYDKIRVHHLIDRMMNLLEDADWKMKDIALMLLANLTLSNTISQELIAKYGGKSLRQLVSWFISNDPEPLELNKATEEIQWDDEYQYIANILANISSLEEGRKLIKEPLNSSNENSILSLLFPQVTSPNNLRKKGVLAVLVNMCCQEDDHYWLYEELDIVSILLFPLVGPEELDEDDKKGLNPSLLRLGNKKKREKDANVRRLILQVFLLLATTRNGRNTLRKKKVYCILRNAHLVEEDELVGEEIYKLVDLLIRDEEGEEPDFAHLQEQENLRPENANERKKASEAVKEMEHLIYAPPIPTNKTKDPNRFQDAEDAEDVSMEIKEMAQVLEEKIEEKKKEEKE